MKCLIHLENVQLCIVLGLRNEKANTAMLNSMPLCLSGWCRVGTSVHKPLRGALLQNSRNTLAEAGDSNF